MAVPTLSGWGRLAAPGREVRGEDLLQVARHAVLFRGLGRSYGDSSLPPPERPEVVATTLADRILRFDPASGSIRAEAGLSLLELNRLFLPRRWFCPVSPGTQFVTLGGMVAADVHGKNHHRVGTFGQHVSGLRLFLADGRVVEVAPDRHPELFRATVGGMGLTGYILEVEFRLERVPSPWIYSTSRRFSNLEDLALALQQAADGWPFSAAWFDAVAGGASFGRGVLLCGRWAESTEAPASPPAAVRRRRVPCDAPNWLLNRWSVGLFNGLYYWRHGGRERAEVVHPDSFFYPLDAILDWNRLYGPRGFIQYQCALPQESGVGGLLEFLANMRELGGRPFLAVLKDFGAQGEGLLSFPRPGFTLALDFPVDGRTQRLVDGMNEAVLRQGGRIYLAKDALTRREHFAAMEPRLGEWQRVRRRWDPEGKIRSMQSVRLLGDEV